MLKPSRGGHDGCGKFLEQIAFVLLIAIYALSIMASQ